MTALEIVFIIGISSLTFFFVSLYFIKKYNIKTWSDFKKILKNPYVDIVIYSIVITAIAYIIGNVVLYIIAKAFLKLSFFFIIAILSSSLGLLLTYINKLK